MKVLQIVQRPQLRGAEIFACQLSAELNRLGHITDILFLFGDASQQLPFDLHFMYLGATEKKRWFDFKAYRKLSGIIKKGGYDIVQANAGDTLKYASLSKKIYRWKTPLVFRNANKISDFITSRSKKLLNRWLISEVDYVASVSELCRKDFIKTFNFPLQRTATLPVGVNVTSQNRYLSYKEMGIDGSGPFILHVGSFVKEKNHKRLLYIFCNVVKDFPQAKLLLAGEGKLMGEIKQLASSLAVNDAVVFLGRRDDIRILMHNADVLVLPSLIEGLPGVILEAFAERLPVVAYDTGGISEVLQPGKTGWLIKKGDEVSFTEAVKDCLRNKPVKMISNAFLMVESGYAVKQIADAFLQSYTHITSALN